MKYFENLPKKNFESTLGTYSISDFFTYIDIDSIKLSTDDVNVDSKTTLLEAAYNIYEDANSFWTFLISNKKINPFDILEQNTEIFNKNNEPKINFFLYSDASGNSGIAFPEGSIVVPYTENSGYSAQWSSVGNFDLNGPLAVIESTRFYDGSMTIKGQKGSTADFISANGLTGDRLCVIYPTGTGYEIQKSVYTGIKKKNTSAVVEIKQISDGKVIFKDKDSSFSTIDELQPAPIPVQPTQSEEITLLESIDNKSKNIFAYPPTDLGFLRAQFITVKYS